MWPYLVLWLVFLTFYWYRRSMARVGEYEAQGIKGTKPIPFLGIENLDIFLGKKSYLDSVKETYDRFRGDMVFVDYYLGRPVVILQDLDLIREIFVKNFDHFTDRMLNKDFQEVHSETSKTLLSLVAEEWKAMRAALSPSFTTGKLKNIVKTMSEAGPDFLEYLSKQVNQENQGAIEMKPVFNKFAMEIIAKAVFGVPAKAFSDEESDFMKHAKILTTPNTLQELFAFTMYNFMPKVAKFLGIRFSPKESWTYFREVIEVIILQRGESLVKVESSDMLQVLIDCRNKHTEEVHIANDLDMFEQDAKVNVKIDPKKIIDNQVIGQSATLFLLAGFDTIGSTLDLISYHLAVNHEVQEKLRQEVDAVAEQLELEGLNDLDYEKLSQLEYMDMVISESQRISPSSAAIERVASKDYVTSTGLKIKKGDQIQVLFCGIHMDPKYWDNPTEFRPERFSKENKKGNNPYAFLPFGTGPRSCIGMRFALIEVKVALYYLIKGFLIHPGETTPVPIKYDKTSPNIAIAGGNKLRLVSRS